MLKKLVKALNFESLLPHSDLADQEPILFHVPNTSLPRLTPPCKVGYMKHEKRDKTFKCCGFYGCGCKFAVDWQLGILLQ